MFLNGYPYTDFHELNLDFLVQSMEVLKKAFKDFTGANSLIFAEPLLHDLTKQYAKNTIVVDENGDAFISLQIVPTGISLSNSDYWLEVFDFEGYVSRANKNFTDNYFSNVDRSPVALSVGDWLVLDDVLYKVTVAIPIDGLFEIGTNIVHFTVEQFLKDFTTSIVQTVNQYKNDIDASELAYRQQLAQDIANTTASLQAQLDAVISGATVDSEVIDARVGYDATTYPTLGTAIRTQIEDCHDIFDSVKNAIENCAPDNELTLTTYEPGYLDTDGTIVGPLTAYKTSDFVAVSNGVPIYFTDARYLAFYDSTKTFVERLNYQNHSGLMLYVPSADGYIKITYSNSIKDHFASDDISVRNKIMFALSDDVDLLAISEKHENKYWNGSEASSPSYTYFVVPIVAGQSYTVAPFSRFIYYYDVNYANGVNDPDGNSTEPYTFTATANGYAFITFEKRYVDLTTSVHKTDYYTQLHEEIGSNKHISNVFNLASTIRGKLFDCLSDKTIMTFGDSIMYGAGNSNVGIGRQLHDMFGSPYYDYSVAGATFGTLAGHSQIGDQVASGILAHSIANIILVNGGTNDMYGTPANCPLGDFTDSFTTPDDVTTFSGGMDWVFYQLKNQYHDALIIYLGSHNMQSRTLERQIDYRKRAFEICDKWGVPYIDMYAIMNTQLQWYNDEYLDDTTHPNAKGYSEYYIPAIERKLYELRNILKISKA